MTSDGALAARIRAYALMEAAQDDDAHGAAARELLSLELEAESRGWPDVAVVAAAGQAMCAVLDGTDREGAAAALDALVVRAESLGAPALVGLACSLRAVAAAGRGDTASLLADAGRAVALAGDEDLSPLDRCMTLVVSAAAYNTLSLWELGTELYDAAAALEPLCEQPMQRPAVTVNRVLIRLEWAAALFELDAPSEAVEQLRLASEAARLAMDADDLPGLWRLDVHACVDLLAFVLEAFGPRDPGVSSRPAVEDQLATLAQHRTVLAANGDVEVLPLLDAMVTLALLRLGLVERARSTARRLSGPASSSTGAASFPAWVRAQALAATLSHEALEAHRDYGRLVSGARWTARLGVLAAARSKIAGERLSAEHAALARDVLLDSLTGLSNRRRFDRWLDHAPAAGRTTALLLIDLDAFKAINDSHGHAVGDEVLRLVGRQVSAHVRPGDLALRLGGDEFAVILEDEHDADEGASDALAGFARAALARADALRDAVSATAWHEVAVGLSVELSIGIAVDVLSPERPGGADRLYRKADADLYAVKSDQARSA